MSKYRGRQQSDMRRAARADPAQERMRRELLRRREEERRRPSYQSANSGANFGDNSGDIDMNLTVREFEPSRGRLVLEFFASHFIALARKSNEFRADGQCRMFMGQVRILCDFGRNHFGI